MDLFNLHSNPESLEAYPKLEKMIDSVGNNPIEAFRMARDFKHRIHPLEPLIMTDPEAASMYHWVVMNNMEMGPRWLEAEKHIIVDDNWWANYLTNIGYGCEEAQYDNRHLRGSSEQFNCDEL